MAAEIDITTPLLFLRVQQPGQTKPEKLDLNFVLEGQISSRLRQFTYTDSENAADKASLTLWNRDLRFPDDPAFDRGNLLVIAWGYPGLLSEQRQLVVDDWTPGFEFKVEAKATSVLMNRFKRTDLWTGLTWKQIVERIAERNGYGAAVRTIDDTGPAPAEIPQNGMSDAAFVKWIAKKLGYQFWIDQRGFFFGQRKLDQASRRTFTLGVEGLDGLLDFPAYEKAPAGNPAKVKLQGIDLQTKKPYEVTGDNASTKGRSGLATILELIDPKTGEASLRERAGAPEAVAATAAQTKAEAQKQADGLFKLAQTTPKKCKAMAYGDPRLSAKSVITLTGLGTRLSGNYYTTEVVHTIQAGEYKMTMSCQRDGTSGSGKTSVTGPASNAAVNTSTGTSAGAGKQLQPIDVVDKVTGVVHTEYRSK